MVRKWALLICCYLLLWRDLIRTSRLMTHKSSGSLTSRILSTQKELQLFASQCEKTHKCMQSLTAQRKTCATRSHTQVKGAEGKNLRRTNLISSSKEQEANRFSWLLRNLVARQGVCTPQTIFYSREMGRWTRAATKKRRVKRCEEHAHCSWPVLGWWVASLNEVNININTNLG